MRNIIRHASRGTTSRAEDASELEDLRPAREHVVERILEVRRILGELLPHLLDVFLVALLDLLTKALAQRALALSLCVTVGKVGDDVRDERACEALCLLIGIVREKWIDRRTRGGRTRLRRAGSRGWRRRPCSRWCGRRRWGGRGRRGRLRRRCHRGQRRRH